MNYLTAQELMQRFGETELAEVAVPDSMAAVSGALMRAVILGESTDDWSADEIDAAEAALTVIDQAGQDADQEIDSYLAQRYGLPLDPVPGIVKRLAANIRRYHLHQDGRIDEVNQGYQDAIRILGKLSRGEMALGIEEPAKASKVGEVQMTSQATRWGRDKSSGFI